MAAIGHATKKRRMIPKVETISIHEHRLLSWLEKGLIQAEASNIAWNRLTTERIANISSPHGFRYYQYNLF